MVRLSTLALTPRRGDTARSCSTVLRFMGSLSPDPYQRRFVPPIPDHGGLGRGWGEGDVRLEERGSPRALVSIELEPDHFCSGRKKG